MPLALKFGACDLLRTHTFIPLLITKSCVNSYCLSIVINGIAERVCERVDIGRLGQRVGFWVGLTEMTAIDTRSSFIVATVIISVIGLALGRLNRNNLGRHKISVDIALGFGVGGRSWLRLEFVRRVGWDCRDPVNVARTRVRSVRSVIVLNN